MQQEAATNSFSSENSVKKSSNNMDENLEATNTVKCSQSPENVKKQNLIQSFEGNEDEQRLDSKAVNQKHSPKPTNWMVVKNSLKELSKLVDADEVEADKKDDASKLEEHIVGNKDDMPFRELPRKEESLPRFLTDGMTVEQQVLNNLCRKRLIAYVYLFIVTCLHLYLSFLCFICITGMICSYVASVKGQLSTIESWLTATFGGLNLYNILCKPHY